MSLCSALSCGARRTKIHRAFCRRPLTSGLSELNCNWRDEYAIWQCSTWQSTKLRGCDVVALRVGDIAPNGNTIDRATIRQRKTGQSVKFELTEQIRQTVDDYLTAAGKKPGDFLFAVGRSSKRSITTRQYARLVSEWVASIGLDPHNYGTHFFVEQRRH